ncbi:MAG: hypothetical protein LBR48_02160 [Dysgonamonadaceae bacterium]|jgi:cell division protein FtsL|nr:hypothetical protein [Dysgonamonadaceae bacterium]
MKINFKEIQKSFVHVFGGKVLTGDLFLRNIRFIIVIIIIMLVFISHRYTVLHQMSEIEKLQRELKDAKYESLNIASDLTEASRQGEIEKMVEKEGMGLKISQDPVYRIRK